MKRCLLVLLLAGSAIASSAPSTLIANVPNRTTISLNGSWTAIVDPLDNGHSGFFRDAKPKDKQELVEYSFDASPVVNVPGDWNTQRDSLMFYEGTVWYRRVFSYQMRAGMRTFVYFSAVNYRATVYLNGEKLGEHEGGFTAFDFECTSRLRDGENSLVVEVNNERRADAVPGIKYDWWNYGGITRDVMLIEVPGNFIQDYSVQLARGSQDEISGWVQLNGAQPGQKIQIEIPEAGVRESVASDASGRAAFRVHARLDLWSPEHPKLYDVVLASGEDKIRDQIGFRTVEVQGSKILLNGKPIFLRGISMHEEAPFREGRAFSPEDAQTLLGWAKELGCNLVRLAHYPHNENEVRWADRNGLLVWSEIPVYWDIDWTDPATLANAEAQLRDMIARDHNRAAVILWSMSNETPVKPERLTFIKQLVAEARELDSTRLITSALNHVEDTTPDVRTMADPLVNELDVVGLNEYLGWYWGRPQDADKMRWKAAFNKPLIVSEFGGGAVAGRHGDVEERWTEEYQQSLFQHQLAMVQRMPNFRGLTPWVLMDFRSPLRLLPGVQDYHNRKGLVSNRGQRKMAFYTLQEFYRVKAAEANSQAH
jgi:beta-glucuronidase